MTKLKTERGKIKPLIAEALEASTYSNVRESQVDHMHRSKPLHLRASILQQQCPYLPACHKEKYQKIVQEHQQSCNVVRICNEKYLEEVSTMVTGTPSGKNSKGNLVSGRTGGTLGGKESVAAATIKLDFPVPLSPTTTIRTDLGEPGQSTVPAEYLAI